MNDRWDLRIIKGDNGYRCNWLEEMDDVDDRPTKICEMVFEEADNEKGELECMRNLLHFVKEHFGIFYAKHSKHNLVVEIQEMHG